MPNSAGFDDLEKIFVDQGATGDDICEQVANIANKALTGKNSL